MQNYQQFIVKSIFDRFLLRNELMRIKNEISLKVNFTLHSDFELIKNNVICGELEIDSAYRVKSIHGGKIDILLLVNVIAYTNGIRMSIFTDDNHSYSTDNTTYLINNKLNKWFSAFPEFNSDSRSFWFTNFNQKKFYKIFNILKRKTKLKI